MTSRWPALPAQGPVRVFSYGARLLPLTPTKDPRPHAILALLADLLGRKP